MVKQYLRKKPFWHAMFPLPWWVAFIGIIVLLVWLMGYFQLPAHLETRV